ncbi:DUF4380 domain-containing protein [Marinilabilia sp.]|uniref:DUF4380 domain-containing protein n=1 Tax=Marinilabilia sp. TaxID=2021252 RepID=UPI0025B9121B|nr:DUF4380 domain-containing protein [Marinilabilia sp.]
MRLFYLLLSVVILLVFSAPGCSSVEEGSGRLITLSNNSLKIILAPELGGRMVFFGHPDGANLLKENEEVWQAHTWPDSVLLDMPFKGYQGMIIWLGPQSHWWIHQDLMPERKAAKAVWPPDPYLIYGGFQVVHLTDSSVILSGPPSPVSGVVMKKEFWLKGNLLQLAVEIENISNDTLGWDIWTNSRFDPETSFYVPNIDTATLGFTYNNALGCAPISHSMENGGFSFKLPSVAANPDSIYQTKAFMYSSEGQIVVEQGNHRLIMSFTPPEKHEIHPEQALIEVYMKMSADESNNLLELEHHSAFQLLAPGEKMRTSQSWILEALK